MVESEEWISMKLDKFLKELLGISTLRTIYFGRSGGLRTPNDIFFIFFSFCYLDVYLHNLLKKYNFLNIKKNNYITLLNPLN